MSYLAILDIFGVEFKQQIQLKVKEQKSIFGGVVSLLILGTSLAYLIYVINEWIQWRLLPKSTNTMKVDVNSSFEYKETENLFEFYYWEYSDQQIDPFRQVNNILIPIGYYFNNGFPSQGFSLLNQTNSISASGTQKFGLNHVKLQQNYQIQNVTTNVKEFMIVFIKCNESFLTEGQNCSTDEEFENFFNSAVNFVFFSINLKQFNQMTKQFEFVKKSYYFSIDRNIATQGQMLLKQTNAFIDNGIILNSVEEQSFISDVQVITLSSSTQLWQNIIKNESFFHMMLRLEPISSELHIVYPKLGEVLAQVGSIANILLLIRYAILQYNEKILEHNFVDQVLGFYFSNYQEIKKSNTHYNKKSCKLLVEQAYRKLVYLNIIYELSRIQLFLQSQFGRNKLKEAHNMGIMLPQQSEIKNCTIQQIYEEASNSSAEPDSFQIEDFFLFSMPNSEQKEQIVLRSR